MITSFSETLKSIRKEKGLSQQELADKLIVDRSTVAKWELGNRLPDSAMIAKIADCLDIDIRILIGSVSENSSDFTVIVVDDMRLSVKSSTEVLQAFFPQAKVSGFTNANEAIEFAKSKPVSLAFLDIELGRESGFDLCKKLKAINAKTNIVFLTAYKDYSFNAWKTEAVGFLTKPLNEEAIKSVLPRIN